ncbi:hypothetical protein DXG01_013373 [Tephrocybe rancida]|nr:hypothetical protein DXG01_013373 [Tephrocybe rancida]
MPPLRGLGPRRCITLTLAALQTTCALKLNDPPIVHLGEAFQVSWDLQDGDPQFMNLFLSCDPGRASASFNPVASYISTALVSYSFIAPEAMSGLNFNSSNGTVLDGVSASVDDPNSVSTAPETSSPPPDAVTSTPTEPTPGSTQEPTSSSTRHATARPTHTATSHSSSSSSSVSGNDSTSQPSASTSLTDPAFTSAVSSSSPAASPPAANLPSAAAKKSINIGAIVGGVVGGLLLLLLLALLLLFLCRRRRRRQKRRLSILHDVKPDPSSLPFPVEKEQALLGLEAGLMFEAVKTKIEAGQHNRSGSSALDHYPSDGYQNPDALVKGKFQPVQYSDNINDVSATSMPMKVHDGKQWRGHELPASRDSSDSSIRERVSPPPGAMQPWRFSPFKGGYDEVARQSSNDVHDIDSMDPETREKRREAILEQMRRVLDGEQKN